MLRNGNTALITQRSSGQVADLQAAMSKALTEGRNTLAAKLFEYQTVELRRELIAGVLGVPAFVEALKPHLNRQQGCKGTELDGYGGCHQRKYGDIFQHKVLGIGEYATPSAHELTWDRVGSLYFISHADVCPGPCTGPGRWCRYQQLHPKRRTLSAAVASPSPQSAFQAIFTSQSAARAAIALQPDVAHDDYDDDDDKLVNAERQLRMAPRLPAEDAAAAGDAPLQLAVPAQGLTPPAVAAPVAAVAPPAVAAEAVAPAAVDASPLAVLLNAVVTMQRQSQEMHVAMMGLIKQVTNNADPAHATARQASRKRTRLPDQKRLLDHLNQRLRSEHSSRGGLMPPAPMRAQSFRRAQAPADAQDSELQRLLESLEEDVEAPADASDNDQEHVGNEWDASDE